MDIVSPVRRLWHDLRAEAVEKRLLLPFFARKRVSFVRGQVQSMFSPVVDNWPDKAPESPIF
jgi:hypothetical protein